MHEEPQVLHYGKPGKGLRLKEGMVITIEPMVNEGRWECKLDSNGWTARTIDGKLSHNLNIQSPLRRRTIDFNGSGCYINFNVLFHMPTLFLFLQNL